MEWKIRLARLRSKLRFRRLGWKLTLSYTLVTVATLLIIEMIVLGFSWTVYFSGSALPKQIARILDAFVVPQLRPFLQATPPDVTGLREYLEGLYTRGVEVSPGQPMLLTAYTGAAGSESVVVDAEGRLLASLPADSSVPGERFVSRFAEAAAPLSAALAGSRDSSQFYTRTANNWYVIVLPIRDESGVVLGAFYIAGYYGMVGEADYLPTMLRSFVYPSFVVVTVVAGVVGTFLGFLTARGLTRRMHVLADNAAAWGGGDFAATVYDTSPDEVGQLGRELNRMAERIQELMAARQQLAGLEERNRLARELHDSVKQQVFAATMNLGAAEALWEHDSPAAFNKVSEAHALLQQTQHELKSLIHELRPAALEDKGLAAALSEYAAAWSQRSGIPVEVHVQGERPTPMLTEWALFRVAQEALANVAKHSAATAADLTLGWSDTALTLTLRDNGRGFTPGLSAGRGMGMQTMRERIAALGGDFALETVPGQGTTVRATAPIVPQAKPEHIQKPTPDGTKSLPGADVLPLFSWYAQSVGNHSVSAKGATMIAIQNLTRRFGTLAAVDALNLSVHSGELFGFLGPNGAGKTTTLRMLVGLLAPTSGTATVAGHDVREHLDHVKRTVGYLPDEPYLYDKLSGREHLRFVAGLYGLTDADAATRVERLLKLVDLEDRADDLIETYSHGMRKRLALCAILLHEPRVLLLDEPLNGLDPRSALRVKEVLRMLCERGATVLLSTHTLEIAERMCDRVGILDHGRLVAVGTMDELRAQAEATAQSTLEDLFMRLTGGEEVADVAAILSGRDEAVV
ncbi:MAG: ATP-binding cassette domain-containing protein [Anaerolineae bacterium]|nr:ATP-binding cassette domain-containing protein [Anaerolineae bacterium]